MDRMASPVPADPFEDSSDDDADRTASNDAGGRRRLYNGRQDRCQVLVEVLYVGFSSVILGSFASLLGPTVPIFMSKSNVDSLSSGCEIVSANATGCIIGVILAMCCFKRIGVTVVMPVSITLCASLTIAVPQSSGWFNSLTLVFFQGVLMGVIDRGRFLLCSPHAVNNCRYMMLVYLAASAGAIIPLASYSAISSSIAHSVLNATSNTLVRRSVVLSANNITGSTVDVLQNITNLTTTLAPQKPKFVDGAGLKSEQTYAERKQKSKHVGAKDAPTTSSTTVNLTTATVVADVGNLSTSGEVSTLSVDFDHTLPTLHSTSVQTTTTLAVDLYHTTAAQHAAFPWTDSNRSRKSLNEVLLLSAVDGSEAWAPAFMTTAAMGYSVAVLMTICCIVLICRRRLGFPSAFWVKSGIVTNASESQYSTITILFSLIFVFLVSTAEALLQSLSVVYFVAEYGVLLRDSIQLCFAGSLLFSVGRFAFLFVKEASGRLVGACLSLALLIAAGTVFTISKTAYMFLVCTVAFLLGPVSPVAFCWLHEQCAYSANFLTLWLLATHLGRMPIPIICAKLMEDHQTKDFPFVLVSALLASVVLLIPIDKVAKESRTYISALVRKSGGRLDAANVAYSKLTGNSIPEHRIDDDEVVHFDRTLQSTL